MKHRRALPRGAAGQNGHPRTVAEDDQGAHCPTAKIEKERLEQLGVNAEANSTAVRKRLQRVTNETVAKLQELAEAARELHLAGGEFANLQAELGMWQLNCKAPTKWPQFPGFASLSTPMIKEEPFTQRVSGGGSSEGGIW